MPIITVTKGFKIAVSKGNEIIDYLPGEHDVSDRTAEVAVKQLKVAKLKGNRKGGSDADNGSSETET